MIKYPPFNLDIPKIGYILAIRSERKGIFEKGIEAKQLAQGFLPMDARYIHVEVLSGGADSMRIAPPKAGPIDITKVYKGKYVKILKYDCALYHEYLRYKIALKYNLLCNKKYDKIGILAFILPFFQQNPDLPFCSEGCCESIQFYYPDFLNGINPDKCFPASFVSDPKAIVHWEGVIE